MKLLKYRKTVSALLGVCIVCAIWMIWLRGPDYANACGRQPCADELAIRQTLREHFGGRSVVFVWTTETFAPDEPQPIVWAARPMFTSDFRRARVRIYESGYSICKRYALELRLDGEQWVIEDNEPSAELISCGGEL
ncbi:MAG TPA: hypothetical protein VD886_26565 [Herpetosiphonaceae bacterium]|nr:hypothetical protein [Herpetosiphonaceae bacterium]